VLADVENQEMKKNSVPQAEGLNQSRDRVLLDLRARERTESGDWPIRKRGYHRALAREEEWAVKLSKLDPIAWFFAWVYGRILRKEITRSDYLLKQIGKDNPWVGTTLIVPFGEKK
jgi:hypothetical protein